MCSDGRVGTIERPFIDNDLTSPFGKGGPLSPRMATALIRSQHWWVRPRRLRRVPLGCTLRALLDPNEHPPDPGDVWEADGDVDAVLRRADTLHPLPAWDPGSGQLSSPQR
eukprot:gene21834-47964_t